MAREMWEDELKFRKDPKNAYVVQLEKEFFEELNSLGYDFCRRMQFCSGIFNEKDSAIIPVFIKYLKKSEHEGFKQHFVGCLGVKGFYDATEYLLNEYEKYSTPTQNSSTLSYVVQAIAGIQDPRYIGTYISFIEPERMTLVAWHIIRMLGNMKVEKAIPHLIKLLDGENKIDDGYHGTVLEYHKYLFSQEAIRALSRFKNPEHIEHIRKFLEPEKIPWIKYPDTKEGRSLLKNTYAEYRKITQRAIKKMGGSV